MTAVHSCTCSWLGGCSNPITQEDLLCNACRAGCNSGWGPEGARPGDPGWRHMRIDAERLTFADAQELGVVGL